MDLERDLLTNFYPRSAAERNVSTKMDTGFHKKSDVDSHCAMGDVTFIGKWLRRGGNSIWQHAALGRGGHYFDEESSTSLNSQLTKTAFNDIIAVSAGLGIYVAFVLELHQDLFELG